ncbi:MAG: right-handed parallel beta-helix repeat-containing protein [Phycisphaeraceae bacterium]|nr:right-handed parallel beta-helix repeat-containing protein [Phycisphaeraceae bacterium]MCW5763424.1 right-handed parallel beta-helix repeat-containing protein [Phycisphaeraceae bacterium]
MKKLILTTAVALFALPALAGPLDPPEGPVASSMKTLVEVEPRTPLKYETTPGNGEHFFVIVQPGSYYLASSLIVTGDTGAILISAPDVTIDMNGFFIARAGGGTSTRPLISVDANAFSNTTIRNGALRESGNHGIVLGRNARIENVTVRNAKGDGINVGQRSIISNCFIEAPLGNGIVVSTHSIVENSTVYSAGQNGIVTSTQGRVIGSFANQCSQSGISVAYGSHVEGCTVNANTAFGITGQLNSGALKILGNSSTNNGSGGIRVYHSSIVRDNNISSSGLQVACIAVIEDGSRIEGNLCHGGPHAVQIENSGIDNLVIGNHSRSATVGNGFATVNQANNMIGPVVSTGGTIMSTSPFANFSR